jgi:hypothetical protein
MRFIPRVGNIRRQDLTRQRHATHQPPGNQPPVRYPILRKTMNRASRRALFFAHVPDPNYVAANDPLIQYYTPPPLINPPPLMPIVFFGNGKFGWQRGHRAVPTRKLAEETAKAGSVVILVPERGTSTRCVQTTPGLAPGPNTPRRQFHQSTERMVLRLCCGHRFVTLKDNSL